MEGGEGRGGARYTATTYIITHPPYAVLGNNIESQHLSGSGYLADMVLTNDSRYLNHPNPSTARYKLNRKTR